MNVFFQVIGAIVIGYSALLLAQHQQRNSKYVGCAAATTEMMKHECWDAVESNYVFIHNAFRNDLQRMINAAKDNKLIPSELENWSDTLDLHSRFEDEVIVVALQARLKHLDSTDVIPNELLSGNDHVQIKELLQLSLNETDNIKQMKLLEGLAVTLDTHLKKEEKSMTRLLMKHFSRRELWAIDSFVVNPKLSYCDKDTLVKITLWWFNNISLGEASRLMVNFIKVGIQSPMQVGKWKDLQAGIPALQNYPVEDIMS